MLASYEDQQIPLRFERYNNNNNYDDSKNIKNNRNDEYSNSESASNNGGPNNSGGPSNNNNSFRILRIKHSIQIIGDKKFRPQLTSNRSRLFEIVTNDGQHRPTTVLFKDIKFASLSKKQACILPSRGFIHVINSNLVIENSVMARFCAAITLSLTNTDTNHTFRFVYKFVFIFCYDLQLVTFKRSALTAFEFSVRTRSLLSVTHSSVPRNIDM